MRQFTGEVPGRWVAARVSTSFYGFAAWPAEPRADKITLFVNPGGQKRMGQNLPRSESWLVSWLASALPLGDPQIHASPPQGTSILGRERAGTLYSARQLAVLQLTHQP